MVTSTTRLEIYAYVSDLSWLQVGGKAYKTTRLMMREIVKAEGCGVASLRDHYGT